MPTLSLTEPPQADTVHGPIPAMHIPLLLMGLLSGIPVAVQIAALTASALDAAMVIKAAVLGGAAGALLLAAIRWALRRAVAAAARDDAFLRDYRRRDTWTYAAFLLTISLGAGVEIAVTTVYLLILAFAAAQGLLLLSVYRRSPAGADLFSSMGWLTFLFLVSGMAALVYEIVWQKTLFAAYGVNIESITIIVSLFMFGLGVGSLIGGRLSAKRPALLPQMFVVCECGIGLFGLVSLPLIHAVAANTLHFGLPGITLTIFALLSLPTMLMGATLPILVTHLHRHYRNIGKSVGRLYFFNTIGSALACVLTVDVLFVFLGKQGAVTVAAGLNFAVAILVAAYVRRLKRASGPVQAPASAAEAGGREPQAAPAPAYAIPFPLVLAVSALAGFLSLSQEILWVRAVAYNAQGAPQVFGHILGFFLFGIAFGARRGEAFCARPTRHPLAYIAGLFLFGAVVYHFSVPFFAQATVISKTLGLLLSYAMVTLVAYIFGNVLPIISHYGIRPGSEVGQSLSWIYMANIVGATAGPLITGFLLLEWFGLEANMLSISLLSVALAGILHLAVPGGWGPKLRFGGLALLCAAAVAALHAPAYAHLFEKLRYGPRYSSKPKHNHLVQNRSGIIAVEPNAGGDIIFGGGGYDGRFNLDPVLNSNGIRRTYMIAGLHPDPAEVLEIGLSSGSWTWVLAAYEKVRRLTVVEINPGYPEVIKAYDRQHQGILTDPKVEYHFDDGRRWLNRNPDRTFDFIIMNTTFHWRANITNLVSEDFLRMARRHLKPGGVIYYNTTHSDDIVYTAARVFGHVTKFSTFVAASDAPFAVTPQERRANFMLFRDGGVPVFSPEKPRAAEVLDSLVRAELPEMAEDLLKRKDLRLITDDNMLTEFKKISDDDAIGFLYRIYDPKLAWSALGRKGAPSATP